MAMKHNVAILLLLGGVCCCNIFSKTESVTGVIGMILLVTILLLGNKSIRKSILIHLDLCCCIMYLLLLAADTNFPISQPVDRIFFAGLTLFIYFVCKQGNTEIDMYSRSGKFSRLGQFALAFILAFQFAGYQTFYDDNGKFCCKAAGLLSFGLFIFWCAGLIHASEFLFAKFRKWGQQECFVPDRKNLIKMATVIFSIIFIIGIAMSIVYYPGIYSQDVVTCYREAINIGDPSSRRDAHSFLYVLLFSIFSKFSRSCYPITIFFITIYSFTNTAFLIYLYKQGIKKILIFGLVVFLTVVPVNMFMMTALWKDIPYTTALISLTHALCKMAVQGKKFAQSKWNILHLFFSLILTALFRSNGVTAVIGTLVIVFILCVREHQFLKGILMTVIPVAIIFIVKVPVYNALQVRGMPESMACQPFNDGIWQNIYIGNEISPDTEAYMYGIMPKQDWIDNYRSYYHNSFAFADRYEELRLDESIRGWLDCLKKYPLDTIGARFLKTDMIWSVFKNKGARLSYNIVLDAHQIELEEKFGWDWLEETYWARVLFSRYFDFFDRNFAVFFRGGWNCVIVLLIIWNSIKYFNKKAILVMAPGICSTLALLSASCYCDYRYIWYMFLLVPFYICNYAVQNRRITDRCL